MNQVPPPVFEVAEFSVAKLGNDWDENEDRSEFKFDTSTEPGSVVVAVSDGATDGYFSGLWARDLVRGACEHPHALRSPAHFAPLLASRQFAFSVFTAEYMRTREEMGRPVTWYERPKIAAGAFATLVALQLRADGSYTALSFGDACVFQTRQGALVRQVPQIDPSQFGVSPPLLRSLCGGNRDLEDHLQITTDYWEGLDRFFLATDALAEWCLKTEAAGSPPWSLLDDLGSRDSQSFGNLMDDLRVTKKMKNDDATLLRLTVHETAR